MAFAPPRQSLVVTNALSRSDAAFFQCDAVQLAKKLVGSYLFMGSSNILVRIVEVEAYLQSEHEVWAKVFDKVPDDLLCSAAGHLVTLSVIPSNQVRSPPYLHIMAQGGDIVHIRGLEPLENKDEIQRRRGGGARALNIFGPMSAAEVFKVEVQKGVAEPLYGEGRIQLFQRSGPIMMKAGPRVLNELMSKRDGSYEGIEAPYRFAAKYLEDGVSKTTKLLKHSDELKDCE